MAAQGGRLLMQVFEHLVLMQGSEHFVQASKSSVLLLIVIEAWNGL
jgi:hypothetical protein